MSVRLPLEVYSPDHIGIALWELGRLIDQVRNSSTRSAVTGGEGVQAMPVSTFLSTILSSVSVAPDDLQALEKLQAELRVVRDSAPVAHLVVSALPGRAVKHELIGWFRKELHMQHLVTFSMRRDIGGGFLLRIGSKQYDFTYRTELLKDKHRLTEIFDGVR